MHDIRNFDSLEEMLEVISEVRNQGMAGYENMPDDVKKLLIPGRHFLQPTSYGFLIFGKIIESEYDEDKRSLAASPHLRLVRAYSVACVLGEVGTQFACNMFPISKYLFDLALASKWDLSLKRIVELDAAPGVAPYLL